MTSFNLEKETVGNLHEITYLSYYTCIPTLTEGPFSMGLMYTEIFIHIEINSIPQNPFHTLSHLGLEYKQDVDQEWQCLLFWSAFVLL
jgi:hypothetical protein